MQRNVKRKLAERGAYFGSGGGFHVGAQDEETVLEKKDDHEGCGCDACQRGESCPSC